VQYAKGNFLCQGGEIRAPLSLKKCTFANSLLQTAYTHIIEQFLKKIIGSPKFFTYFLAVCKRTQIQSSGL